MRQALDEAEAQPGERSKPRPNAAKRPITTEGDYLSYVADVWNRSWALPASVPRAEARTLFVLARVKINRSGEVVAVTFDRLSGNPTFDKSVADAWKAITRLHPPPGSMLPKVLEEGLPLKLNWRRVN